MARLQHGSFLADADLAGEDAAGFGVRGRRCYGFCGFGGSRLYLLAAACLDEAVFGHFGRADSGEAVFKGVVPSEIFGKPPP